MYTSLALELIIVLVEEKYGKRTADTKPKMATSDTEDATESSSASEEDDEGILASGKLDQQFQATLTAIRAKDPRVYDKRATFYTSIEEDNEPKTHTGNVKEKPMYLSDYHRKNILEGVTSVEESETVPTYTQEQNDIKASIIQEIHASADGVWQGAKAEGEGKASENEAEEGFLVPKASNANGVDEGLGNMGHSTVPDVESADQDPEKFLADFMSSRAWVRNASSSFQPFESDDEEEERRADEFEEAYNLRFEDPNTLNEKLVTHARDAAARYSVRREALTGRKRAREIERAKREAQKQEREGEKARLRKLRIADAEEKIRKIKEAAGLRDEHLHIDDWSRFLEDGWDDQRWEEEMRKSFGDTYYADHDVDKSGGEAERKSKVTKPKWKDEIDINDLVPDFEGDGQLEEPPFRLSDVDSDDSKATVTESDGEHTIDDKPTSKSSGKVQRLREQKEHQKYGRKERRQIEQLVDQNIGIDGKLADMRPKHQSVFRYRETSPVAYGLTAQDILMASDSQLNQYAGLKKLAAFRDSTKKAKDRKRLGKKARLRQWRKETFGDEYGPQKTLADVSAPQDNEGSKLALERSSNVGEGRRRKKRSKTKGSTAKSL